MAELGWEAWATVGVLVLTVAALVKEIARPDLVFVGSLGLVLLMQVVPPAEALAGFANPAVLTLAALFVVAAGVQRTNALGALDALLFGESKSLGVVLLRFMAPTTVLSAFLNNTPIVAMLIPRIQRWAGERGLATSKLLIPLSYAAIVGGTMTLIGTSTNIVVAGLLESEGYATLGMFDLTWVGLPAGLLVLLYLAVVGHRLLPDRGRGGSAFGDGLEECLFELKVKPGAELAGQTIEEAELRNLGDAYLVHVRRQKTILPAAPELLLEEGDELAFSGRAAALDRLLTMGGLGRVLEPVAEIDELTLPLFEAVVSAGSNLVAKTLKGVNFREQYGGVVLGIQRRDAQTFGPLGQLPLKAGDLLLIEAMPGFDQRWNERRDEFYLVAPRRLPVELPQPGKAPLALLILLGMVVVAALGLLPLVTAAIAAALAMILTRCVRGAEARRSVNTQVLVVVGAALGIGHVVQATGLAQAIAGGLLGLTGGGHPILVLITLYVATNLLTELVTNNAAAALMLPIAVATVGDLGIDPKAAAITVAIAASASFMTPIGYQTNLMVMSPGQYRFQDYVKIGLPVSVMVMGVAVTVIYLRWLA
ncbi:MAG: SLC13 family permease [Bacteroidota bacterium]